MEVSKEQTFHHFSHQHPLELSLSPSTINTCQACNLIVESGKQCYSCKACSFSLHQICSSIPRKTHHPAHPSHPLTLFILPPSAGAFNCKACAQNVTGFYYSCAECSIYYHILCLTLPLSVTISSHHHTLKVEFSPPYDFCCDLCRKPSYKGWLYRCHFCEFDAHISCAISNQRAKYLETELMQLVVRRFVLGNEETGDQKVADPVSAGQTKLYMPSPFAVQGDASKDQDLAAPASEDHTIPSYQFSDTCFSIDLVKSYSSQEHINHAKDHQNGVGNASRDQQVQQHDFPNKAVLNPLYKGLENTFNQAYMSGTVTHSDEKLSDVKRSSNGYRSQSGISERSIKSGTANSRWGKFLTCCYYPSYQKCSKSFKNGGL